jgi:hypothetical protein
MRNIRIPLVVLALTVFAVGLPSMAASPKLSAQSTALERGYRTGYSDGYNAGYKDVADGANRDFLTKDEYVRADRSYNQVWGPIEDYRDGYQQGFENGYGAGYARQGFNSAIPTGLRRRETGDERPVDTNPAPQTATGTVPETAGPAMSGGAGIPRDTLLTIELLSPLSTDVSQQGDRFQARVVQSNEYEGALVDGRVISLKRPGRVKGVAELQLSFERIRLPDNRSASFRADVVEVVQMSSGDGVGQVEPEGGVKGKDSTKDDVSKVGAATGIGAIIGAIAGGGKGAAIGAVIGGAVGTGGVLSQRGKHIRLPQGQQLRIRTVNDTQF